MDTDGVTSSRLFTLWRHVVENIEHQVVVRLFSMVKQFNLRFQQAQKLREIRKLLLELVDVVRHDGHLKGRGATTLQTRHMRRLDDPSTQITSCERTSRERDVPSYRHG
jgi:hypothetical protein